MTNSDILTVNMLETKIIYTYFLRLTSLYLITTAGNESRNHEIYMSSLDVFLDYKMIRNTKNNLHQMMAIVILLTSSLDIPPLVSDTFHAISIY